MAKPKTKKQPRDVRRVTACFERAKALFGDWVANEWQEPQARENEARKLCHFFGQLKATAIEVAFRHTFPAVDSQIAVIDLMVDELREIL